MDLIHPSTKTDVAEDLKAASAAGTRLLIVGGRQHIDRGEPAEADAELWTTQLDAVVSYVPAEMLVVVGAGIRCGELAGMLAEHQQEWPVDAPADATVGGVIAAGVSSPRRLRVGHVRDTVVEMELVTGDGRLIKSGARTVKNVTGYDVHRLATGSLGTLGVIVQVALKVRPLPESRRSLVVAASTVAEAERVHDAVPAAAAVIACPTGTELLLEGWRGEVEQMERSARNAIAVSAEGSMPVAANGARTTLEAAVPPSRLSQMVGDGGRWRALVGVGLAWMDVDTDEELREIRERAAALGGIAPAIRGPGGLGGTAAPALRIHRRLKSAFDPAAILAPGRFWAGL